MVDARGRGWGGEGEWRVSVYQGQSLSLGRWKIPEMADGEAAQQCDALIPTKL